MKKTIEDGGVLTRRSALGALIGASVAIGCGGAEQLAGSSSAEGGGDDAAPGDEAAAGDGGAGATSNATESGTCEVTPEGEIGPYFADDGAAGFGRSDIRSNLDGSSTQPGVPLTLTVTVVDAQNGCVPYVGAQVDVWHCNATGVYSDIASEGTSSDQWLRGYQLTDASGRVTFTTIIPGWYQGRTTHIHLRVRSTYGDASSTSDASNTTQCFFSSRPSSTRSTRPSRRTPRRGRTRRPTRPIASSPPRKTAPTSCRSAGTTRTGTPRR